ncbi:choice-of-anchor D domain-containing protein, partial [bacterium]|nr:choice-of-anchor D domain-containing protein [bacterium]
MVTYSVVTLGDVAGTVTIASDDPDEPVIEVALSGTGVKPPVITVTPDSLTAELYPGGVVAQTLTIGNVGHSDLFWSATMVAGGSRQLYRLPPLSGSPARSPEAGAPTLVPSAERKLTELTAELSDLTGVRIVWDRAHGQLPPESYYSWIVAELEARGAVVAVNLEPFTSTSLASADIVWTLDAWYAFTPAELSALTAWLHGGGGLLLEGDETPTSFNALLAAAGAGITYGGSVSSEITTAIHPHVTTVGIDELLLASPLSGLSAVVAPAGLLAQDMYGRSALAWSEVAGGRVVALCDELFEDYAITYADNRLFGHQVIDWLAGTGWLQLKPAEGVVAAGASQDVTVTFDASNRCGGALAAGIAVASNDPLTPTVTVPAALDVLGESDITVSPTSLAFGARFLGAVVTDTLTVANDGCELLTIDGVTSDHAEFSVAPAGPFTLAPAARQRIVVTYAPATVGAVSGTLTVASDDPDEPVIAVVLTGTGVKPPVITVTPDTLAVALAPGGATTRTLTIGNTGYSDLVWSAAVVASGARKPYRLPPPPASPARVPEAGSPVSTLPAERTLKELAVDLRDLTGVRILWDQAHGQVEPWGYYSTLVADLQARGAEVFVNLAPFTPESLAAVDIVWTLEMYNPVAPPEVSALAAWLLGGGGLLLEGDQSNTSFNSLLAAAGAGITYGGDAASGTTTAIHTHETTVGIDELLLGGPMTGLSAVVAPAGLLAQDAYGQPALAWSQVLGGRVVALCDELFEDYVISYLDNRLFGNQVFDWLAGPNWLQLDPAAGVVAAGATQDVLATFDAADLCGGALAAGLAVASNDPLRPVVTVPAALDVLGESDIAVSPTSLAFGAHFLGAVVTDTLTVANDGCELLTIAGVKSDHAEFSALPAGPFTLAPDASLVVVVTYAPVTGGAVSGTLAVASDDPDEPFIAIALTGTGVKPPVITVAPDTLAVALAPGGATTRTLTIGNTGHSDLIWTVAAVDTSEWRVVDQSPVFRGAATDPTHGKHLPGSAADAITDGLRETYQATGPKASSAPRAPTSQSRADLAEILANLDAGFGAVTGLIPSRFDFTDGVTGTSISDGGNDMYDGGNVLSTNLGGSIPYRDGLITNSAVFGAGGRYFTRKYPGLFALVADVEGIARFEINGNLGADGYGSADGAVLETTVGGRRYLGFVKRVFGAGNPSVNHLVIVAADAAAAHAFATNTNDDWHQVTGLGGQPQIYYLLYAAANGGYINNPTTLLIMEAFLTGIGLEPDWLRFEPQSGTTAAGATQELTVTFDAAAFCGGEAAAAIIVSSNDPLRPQTGVLAMLDVLGEADIAVSPTSLDFGARFIGATRTDTLLVANLGCEQLTVSGVTSDQVAFSATPAGPFTLAPDSTRTVLVTFAPTTAGVVTAQLTFAGDDPDEPTVVVALAGTGLEPPVITVAPDTLAVALAPGETATRTLAIGNAGASELWWSAVAVADHPRKLFRLPPLAPSPSPSPEAGASAAPPPGVHASTELTAELRDLTGVQILWDRAHGQLPPRNHHGAMLAELAARGAEVNESHAPLTVDLLGSCDILWLFETTLPFTTEERSAVATWLHDGGSLLLEGDGSPSPFNALLAAAGAGIVYGNGAQAGITTIYPHATTVGVDSLYLSGPWSGLSAVLAPAGILARSSDGQAAMAWSEVGAGRIVAFCDEVLVDYAITVADNRLFGNQVIDWLATPGWLRLEPTMGVVAAGASQDVTVTFNAASRCGDFAARITVTSNDPVNPTLAVAARMDVAGAPDIDVAPTRLAFGSHYTGTATTAALVVANDGCAPLTVSGVTSDQAAFTVVPAGPFTVPRDSTRSVAVTFAPATAGGISGQLTIASDDPDEPAG